VYSLKHRRHVARLIVWMAIGLVIYFTYGRYHSKLQRRHGKAVANSSLISARFHFGGQ